MLQLAFFGSWIFNDMYLKWDMALDPPIFDVYIGIFWHWRVWRKLREKPRAAEGMMTYYVSSQTVARLPFARASSKRTRNVDTHFHHSTNRQSNLIIIHFSIHHHHHHLHHPYIIHSTSFHPFIPIREFCPRIFAEMRMANEIQVQESRLEAFWPCGPANRSPEIPKAHPMVGISYFRHRWCSRSTCCIQAPVFVVFFFFL